VGLLYSTLGTDGTTGTIGTVFFGSSGIPVKKNSLQRRRVHREFVQIMTFTQFSLRPPRLGGEISQYCFTQKPEEPIFYAA
jgi:hypothetical protein